MGELGRPLADPARHLRDRARSWRRNGVKPLAVFRFISEDWSPWIALLRMRERWPELSFKLMPSYLDRV